MNEPAARLTDTPEDRELLALVRPSGWVNPKPAERYNLVVIGAGPAGLVAAAGAAGLGARVALVERGLMGGDCLVQGCVPSKALIRSARTLHDARNAGDLGITGGADVTGDFPAIMARMRRLRTGLAPHDSARRFRDDLGVDLFFGAGRFTASDKIEVAGTQLRFSRAVICTGARPAVPPLPGLAEAGFLTNESIFSLTELPLRLAIIGGGAIGCELAQAFARFGSRVLIIEGSRHILGRDDRDAAEVLLCQFRREGIEVRLGTMLSGVMLRGADRILTLEQDGVRDEVATDAILVAVGRNPVVADLGLETAGIEYDRHQGVTVNDLLRTTNPAVYAAGDCCSPYRFTHTADAQARIVIANALFMGRQRFSTLAIPWTTYTDPEVAHMGFTGEAAAANGIKVTTLTVPYSEVDRAVIDAATAGFVRVHLKQGSDTILGATIVASHAGEMIGEFSLAMSNGLGLTAIGKAILPYPTQAEAIRKLADAYNRTRLTPVVKRAMDSWLAWRRE